MRRTLDGSLELDDDPARVDVHALHAFLTEQSYWAGGRTLAEVEATVAGAARVVGLYDGDALVGFARAVSDELTIAYLADVYVLPDYRGRGLGVELVGEMVEAGPLSEVRWMLRTADAHGLYRQFGFGTCDESVMTRPALQQASAEGP